MPSFPPKTSANCPNCCTGKSQRMASLFFPGCYPSTTCNLHNRQKINLTTSSSASRRKPLLLSLRRKETGGEIRAIYFILKSNIKSRLRTFPSFNGICQEINCFRKEARPADTVGRARPDDSVRTGVAEVLVPIKIFTRKLIGRSRGGKAMFSCLSLMGVAQGTSSLSILKNGSTATLFQIIAHGINTKPAYTVPLTAFWNYWSKKSVQELFSFWAGLPKPARYIKWLNKTVKVNLI